MEIRSLVYSDIPLAMELKITCWTEELSGKAENTLKLNDEVAFWTNWMNTPDENNDFRLLLGAFVKADLLGVAFASFVDSKDSPENGIELNGLWVFPQYRGNGISLKLILEILNYYIPLGVISMRVYNPHYAPSNEFYRKFGGTIINSEHQLDGKLPIDIFEFNTLDLKNRLTKTLLRYS